MPCDTWIIQESGFDQKLAKNFEGIFTLGNGYMHVRGSLEELLQGQVQNRLINHLDPMTPQNSEPLIKAGTFVPGLLGKPQTARRQIVNLPFFFDIAFEAGNERLDMCNSRVENFTRQLDLRSALLQRRLDWLPKAGGRITIEYERFISAANSHLAAQRVKIQSTRDICLEIYSGINADVTTVDCDLFVDRDVRAFGDDTVECGVETNLGETVRILAGSRCPGVSWRFEKDDQHGRFAGTVTIPAGRSIVLEKRIAVTTSRDRESVNCEEVLRRAESQSYEQLFAEHVAVWEERWQCSDVQIDGDPVSQVAIRHSLYHLHRALVRGDDRVAVCAKGYAGELYQGLFFWDTETFLLPFYLYTCPGEARTLCDYRVNALEGAKRNAAKYHYIGARYPWTADPQGDECCEPWLFKDHQIHVTADVVYGMAHWAAATNSEEYLAGNAGQVILQTARYWLDRVDYRTNDDRPHLLGVMGPDEFTAMTSDNSYTNRVVRFAMALAAEYGRRIGATEEEIRLFADVAERLPMPRREDGLVMQCEEFDGFAEIDMDGLWKNRAHPFEWQVPRERIHHSKVLKQADVLMLMLMFSHEYTDDQVRAAWDFYHPLTTHDSSLSPGVHGMIATRLGMMDIAEEYWRRTVELDLRHGIGGAQEGIHIACCGAGWQMAVLGFAGMKTALQSDIFTLDPRLLPQWTRLHFPVVWKGQGIDVQITQQEINVTNRSAADLPVCLAGRHAIVPPKQSYTVNYSEVAA